MSEDSYFGEKVSKQRRGRETRKGKKRKEKEKKGKEKKEGQRLPRYTLASRAGILERDWTRDTHALPKS